EPLPQFVEPANLRIGGLVVPIVGPGQRRVEDLADDLDVVIRQPLGEVCVLEVLHRRRRAFHLMDLQQGVLLFRSRIMRLPGEVADAPPAPGRETRAPGPAGQPRRSRPDSGPADPRPTRTRRRRLPGTHAYAPRPATPPAPRR